MQPHIEVGMQKGCLMLESTFKLFGSTQDAIDGVTLQAKHVQQEMTMCLRIRGCVFRLCLGL
jgi:hypothetical protein